MNAELWLPVIFAGLMALSMLIYVVLDGYDLGVGVLLPLGDDDERDAMIASIGPFWDANETWLVLGGAGLLAAFPLAYAVILSAFYLPLMLMLIGLVFRGVAFEFRMKARAGKRRLWDQAFIGGSVAATFFQGVTLGAFLDGQLVGGLSLERAALRKLRHPTRSEHLRSFLDE